MWIIQSCVLQSLISSECYSLFVEEKIKMCPLARWQVAFIWMCPVFIEYLNCLVEHLMLALWEAQRRKMGLAFVWAFCLDQMGMPFPWFCNNYELEFVAFVGGFRLHEIIFNTLHSCSVCFSYWESQRSTSIQIQDCRIAHSANTGRSQLFLAVKSEFFLHQSNSERSGLMLDLALRTWENTMKQLVIGN